MWILHNDSRFLPGEIEIGKCAKLACNFNSKEIYLLHIRCLKQAINQCLVLEKVQAEINFYWEAWVKSYIDMDTKLWKNASNDFEKDFF